MKNNKLVTTSDTKSHFIGRWMEIRIGYTPLPVYIVLATIIMITAFLQQLPVNMLGGFAVILTMGWLLGTIGANLPVLKHFGGPAILSLLLPSILVFFQLN